MTIAQAAIRCVLLSVLFLSQAGRLAAEDLEAYKLATATTGGTYHPVGEAIATVVNARLAGEGINLEAVNTAGSQENVELLRRGEVDFAILSGLAAYQGMAGIGSFSDAGPFKDFRSIASLWRSADHFVLRSELVNSGTIADLAEVAGISASFGKKGSGTLLKNTLLFENLDIPIERFDLAYEGYKGSVKLFEDQSISAMNLSGGVPVSAMADALEKFGSEITVLDINDEQLARLDGGVGLWSREIVPANTYPGQARDIKTSATPNILAVRADVPIEDVHAITRTIFDNLDLLGQQHSAAKQIKIDQATVSLPVPLHPGAERYFKERGLRVPIASAEFGDAFLSRYRTKTEARETVNRGKVGIITGPTTHSSARAIDDIASAVDRDGLRIIAMTGKGAGQNVTDLLYLRGVDAAVVGMDYLRYAKQYAYPDLDERLKILTPLFDEEVHIVVKRGTYGLEQLSDRKVNFGERGSGTELTAEILFRHMSIDVERTSHQDQVALELVKNGEIAAAVFVSAKPMPLLEGIDLADGLRFLSVPHISYQNSYVESTLTRDDYPWLIDPKGTDTIAVRTALMSYNWQPDTARFEGVRLLAETLIDNLAELSATGRHPKLRDVDPMADFGGWPRLKAVDDYLARRGLAAGDVADQRYN